MVESALISAHPKKSPESARDSGLKDCVDLIRSDHDLCSLAVVPWRWWVAIIGALLLLIALLIIIVLTATLFIALVLGVADRTAAKGSKASTNGGTFKATTTLVADDAAYSRTAQTTNDSSSLGIRTHVFAGDQREKRRSAADVSEVFLHGVC